MTTRKILSLVTAVTATAGAAASAVEAKPSDAPAIPARWAEASNLTTVVLLNNTPYLVTPNAQPVPIAAAELGRYLGETQPLIGPDGRPGCGNILSKGPTGCDDARTAALAARLRAAAEDPAIAMREAEHARRVAARVVHADRARDAAKAKTK